MQSFTPSNEPRLIRSAYSPKAAIQLVCLTKGRTKQSFKDECDINTIIRRFLRTGVMDFTAKNERRYGDCTGLEYTQAMQKVAAAKSLFNELPGRIRARFDNEPALFLDFVQDERNREEATEMGLLKPVVRAQDAEAPPPAPMPAAPASGAPAAA